MSDRSRRMTRQRRIILEELERQGNHPTADEIYEAVRRELPRISLGTVYRNLQTLVEDGAISSLREGGRMRFDGNALEHYHVRCLNCGRLEDVPVEEVDEPAVELERRSGYRILAYRLEFTGLCPGCREAMDEEELRRRGQLGRPPIGKTEVRRTRRTA